MYLLNRFRQPNGDDEHTGNESWDKQQLGVIARIKDFVLGPEYLLLWQPEDAEVVPNEKLLDDPYEPVEQEHAEVGDVTVDKPVRADASIKQITVMCEEATAPAASSQKDPTEKASGTSACESTTGLKDTNWEKEGRSRPGHVLDKSMKDFNQQMQVYNKVEETSFLPFRPPPFFTNILSMLGGTFKVFQYVVTVLVALMAMQHAVDRYWQLQGDTSLWQNLLFFVFISYPMITLLLVVLTNNEMAIRRFCYYRMMSLQVIIDWENKKMWHMWFFAYFMFSFIILLCYGFWAGWLTKDDSTVSVWPQLSIVAMQSMLLFMFWLTAVNMEEQLVPLNRVIENETGAAKELIQRCTVVTEEHFKAAIMRTYTRKRDYKRLKHTKGKGIAEQAKEGMKMLEPGTDSMAAWFDLNRMRAAGGNKYKKHAQGWLQGMCNSVYDMMWGKCYAVWFATSFWSISLFRFRRCTDGRQHVSIWPYPNDAAYFRLLGLLSGICACLVFAVEAYAVWFVVFASNGNERETYGVTECKLCYDHHNTAAATCKNMATTESCWAAAERGYCAFEYILLNALNLNGTQVAAMDTATCRKNNLLSWA